jgi:hypothetical protein
VLKWALAFLKTVHAWILRLKRSSLKIGMKIAIVRGSTSSEWMGTLELNVEGGSPA